MGFTEFVSRYRPFIVLVVGVLVVALVLPMRDDPSASSVTVAGGPATSGGSPAVTVPPGASPGAVPGATPSVGGDAPATGAPTTDPSDAPAPGAPSPGAPPTAPSGNDTSDRPGTPSATESVPAGRVSENCDPSTGRIKVPSVYAPPCVRLFDGNSGADYQGITGETIKVAVYLPQLGAGAATAYIAAGGDADAIDQESMKDVYEGFRQFFNTHYETYGREVEFVYVEGSGGNQDAQAAKADAIRVAEEHKAFASIGGPAALQYTQELAARGVLCITCANGLPIEFYLTYEPFVWTERPGWSVGALHVGEIIGKMLWGRPARWAGDDELRAKTRSFANVYYETPEQAYKAGADRLDAVMAQYDAFMEDTIAYPFDLGTAQSQARTIIARLKDKGITSVLMATDWAYPVFFTQEATNQNYNPEWFSSGASVLNMFGRSYDQSQWRRAYSANIAPLANDITDAVRLWEWHFGEDIPVTCCFWNVWLFFTGVHMAGPTLTPQSFQAGMFAYPPSGGRAAGHVSSMQMSWGNHGGFGFVDYTGIDDLDLAWWDPAATGPDEVGNFGAGMWRHMDGGKHYLPGEYPWEEPDFFNPEGTITQHTSFPPGEAPPDYPPPENR